MRFTIDEYAQAYSISPEMVHTRLGRNRLNYIIEDDTTYIVVPKHQVPYHVNELSLKQDEDQDKRTLPALEKKTTVATVIGLYQKENRYLKVKIEELEEKVDRLIADKEQLLKEERIRIEKVYADKDAQLKTILELINTKLLQEGQQEVSSQTTPLILEEVNPSSTQKKLVELKQYLRSLNIKSAIRKKIKRRFTEAFGADSRILLKNGLFYLDLEHYDYSDLIQ
ncbi:MAG TPA: hypothetical protein EYO73_12190 [Sulfurimonas sp.]|nr:hypothetical protein [Sulfurimonas sp.]